MNRAGDLNDPRPRLEGPSEMVGEHEVTEMVDAEMDLEPVLRDPPGGPDPGIVDQHIQLPVTHLKAASRLVGGVERCQIEVEVFGAASGGFDVADDCLCPLLRATGGDDVKAPAGQLDGGGTADAR
jgi:hypothetical protein